MKSFSLESWRRLWHTASLQGEPDGWYERLAVLYAEPHRHYHNQRHIAECLEEFSEASDLASDPIAVEWALWFHDAIYDPRAADNEEQSAALADQCLKAAAVTEPLLASIHRLILATKTHDATSHPDAPLLVDVDLSILGKPPARFWDYEARIRKEYAWVTDAIFSSKRAEILERFLQRPQIYTTENFFRRYEVPARENLQASIEKLRAS